MSRDAGWTELSRLHVLATASGSEKTTAGNFCTIYLIGTFRSPINKQCP
jgi:hypothetical protein